METGKNQVALFNLVFTQNWEDPVSDQAALKIKSGDTVFAITSGACNVLGFLLHDPKIIYSIDINPAQSRILELKIAAIRGLDFEEFIAFSGIKKNKTRKALFDKIKPLLSKEALAFWSDRDRIIKDGFFMNGKYERFIRIAGRFMNLLQGKRNVSKLFSEKSGREQEQFYDEVWNTKRFHYLFKIILRLFFLRKHTLTIRNHAWKAK